MGLFKKAGGDAQELQSVNIGNQIWALLNLDVNTFRNGDELKEITSIEGWKEAAASKTPAYWYYELDPANGAKFGKMYNGYAIIDSRKLAPKGWHIPDEKEWDQLMKSLGIDDIEAQDSLASTLLRSQESWVFEPKKDQNKSGFSALAGGGYTDFSGFGNLGTGVSFWTSALRRSANIADRLLIRHISSYFKVDMFEYLDGSAYVRVVKD